MKEGGGSGGGDTEEAGWTDCHTDAYAAALGELGKEKWRDGGPQGRQERRESVLLFAFSSPPCEK